MDNTQSPSDSQIAFDLEHGFTTVKRALDGEFVQSGAKRAKMQAGSVQIPGATVTLGSAPRRRRRTSFRGRTRSNAFRRGRRAGRRRPTGFPFSKFGATYVPRGTPEGLARYGASLRAATPEQRAMRAAQGWTGAGDYEGQGGFFRRIGRGLRNVASRVVNLPVCPTLSTLRRAAWVWLV